MSAALAHKLGFTDVCSQAVHFTLKRSTNERSKELTLAATCNSNLKWVL
jgi:hypothetical protein